MLSQLARQSPSSKLHFVFEFKDDYSVEVDAIPPRVLQGLVSDCIERHIDEDALNRLLSVERAERESLHMILDAWRKGAVEE